MKRICRFLLIFLALFFPIVVEAEQQGMDAKAIKAGDYTSVAGFWVNGQGHSLEIEDTGLLLFGSDAIEKWELDKSSKSAWTVKGEHVEESYQPVLKEGATPTPYQNKVQYLYLPKGGSIIGATMGDADRPLTINADEDWIVLWSNGGTPTIYEDLLSEASFQVYRRLPDGSMPDQRPVTELVGVWKNSQGHRYEIKADEVSYRDNVGQETYALPSDQLTRDFNTYLLRLDNDKKEGLIYAPAGLKVSSQDQSHYDRERLLLMSGDYQTAQGADYVFYRVSDHQGEFLWHIGKANQLAELMTSWGSRRKEAGYQLLSSSGRLFLDGEVLDASFSYNGQSESDYSLLATYQYDRGDDRYHIYHFALTKDGRPVVFYSETKEWEQERGDYAYPVSNLGEDKKELEQGFAQIVNSREGEEE